MTAIRVAGFDVQAGTLTMPLVGAWHFEGLVDADAGLEPGEFANIEIEGGATLFGVIRRGGVAFERAEIQVVGGAGGLSREVASAGYRNATARIVATDILTAVGEELSTTSDATVLGASLPFWGRQSMSAGAALDALVDALSASWRVLDDGTVWIGVDAYSAIVLPADAEVLAECRPIGQRTLVDETLSMRPGRTLDGVRIAHVVHRISPDGIRTDVYAPRETTPAGDPIRTALAAFVGRVMRRVDYHALYPARVVSQSGDDSLDVQPDDARMPPLQRVPIRTFAPEISIKVQLGARVLVGFEAGDPKRPYAALWQSGALISVALAGSSDAAALAAKVLTELQAVRTWANTHTHGGVTTGDGSTAIATPMSAPQSVASTKLLLGG